MLSWPCVELGAKDAKDACEAKLTVVVRPGKSHNCVDEVNSQVIFVSIGEPPKKGRANSELVGFIQFLLGLEDGQVKLEASLGKKGRTVLLSGLKHDKRSLIWQLQSKVGQRHSARFASEQDAAARRAANPQAAKRRKDETSEYRRLQEEAEGKAISAAAAAPSPNAAADKAAVVASRPCLPARLRVIRPGEVARAGNEDEERPATDSAQDQTADAQATSTTKAGAITGNKGDCESSLGPAVKSDGIKGLAQYSSEESSDEEDDDDEDEED